MADTKNTGKHDDFRRMVMDDFPGVENVYMYDSSLEIFLYGQYVSETGDQLDVSVPQVKRSY